jgi:hypothetical protein
MNCLLLMIEQPEMLPAAYDIAIGSVNPLSLLR